MSKSKKSKKAAKGKGPKKFAYLAEAREKLEAKTATVVEHNGLMTLDEAKQHAEQGQAMAAQIVNDWWALGLHAKEGLEHGGAQALGLSVTKWYETLYGGSWQMIRRTVEHLKRLAGVPLAELRQIPDCNAATMRLLPESLRTTKTWLDKAKNDTGEAFTEAVYAKRADLGIKDEAMVKTGTAFKLNSIPASLGPLLTDCLKHAAAENDLNLEEKAGRVAALEVIVSHYHGDFCQGVIDEVAEGA